MIKRYITLLTLFTLPLWGMNKAAADSPAIPHISDLAQEAQAAQQQKTPVLLMFSSDHCPYCERVKNEFLKPMLISGDYTDKILIRRVEIDGGATLRDFDGGTVSARELANRYGIKVVPTLVFLGPNGEQLASQLVGLSTPDFYGWYIDEAIREAGLQLKQTKTAANL